MLDPEIIKALELVEQEAKQHTPSIVEHRIYYDEDGHIVGYYERDYPPGDRYIVQTMPDLYFQVCPHHLRVVNGELKYVDPNLHRRNRLRPSSSGQPVVKNMAALALFPNENYAEVEYYDRRYY